MSCDRFARPAAAVLILAIPLTFVLAWYWDQASLVLMLNMIIRMTLACIRSTGNT